MKWLLIAIFPLTLFAGDCPDNMDGVIPNADGTVCYKGLLFEDMKDYNDRKANTGPGVSDNGGDVSEPVIQVDMNNINAGKANCPSYPVRLTMLPNAYGAGSDWYCADPSNCVGTRRTFTNVYGNAEGYRERSEMHTSQRPIAGLFDDNGFIKSCYTDPNGANMAAMKARCPAMSDTEYNRMCPPEQFDAWSRQGEDANFNPSPCGTGRNCGEYIEPGFTFGRINYATYKKQFPNNTKVTAVTDTEPNSLDIFDVNSVPGAKVAYYYRTKRINGLPRRYAPITHDGIKVFIPFTDKECNIDSGCGQGNVATSGRILRGAGANRSRPKCYPERDNRSSRQIDEWNNGGWHGKGLCLTFMHVAANQRDSEAILFGSNRNKAIESARDTNSMSQCRNSDFGYHSTKYGVTEEECVGGDGEANIEAQPEPEPTPAITNSERPCVCTPWPDLVCYNNLSEDPKQHTIQWWSCTGRKVGEAPDFANAAKDLPIKCKNYPLKIDGEAVDCCGWDQGTDLSYVCSWMARNREEFYGIYESGEDFKIMNRASGKLVTVEKP